MALVVEWVVKSAISADWDGDASGAVVEGGRWALACVDELVPDSPIGAGYYWGHT